MLIWARFNLLCPVVMCSLQLIKLHAMLHLLQKAKGVTLISGVVTHVKLDCHIVVFGWYVECFCLFVLFVTSSCLYTVGIYNSDSVWTKLVDEATSIPP